MPRSRVHRQQLTTEYDDETWAIVARRRELKKLIAERELRLPAVREAAREWRLVAGDPDARDRVRSAELIAHRRLQKLERELQAEKGELKRLFNLLLARGLQAGDIGAMEREFEKEEKRKK